MASSVIRAFAYDPDARRLTITFVTGRRYAYSGVPAEIARGLGEAASPGGYFNLMVRDTYPAERLRKRASD